MRCNGERGRTEYLLVNLVDGPRGRTAYPMGKGSGSVTAFSRADGFVTIGRHAEIVEAGSDVAIAFAANGDRCGYRSCFRDQASRRVLIDCPGDVDV